MTPEQESLYAALKAGHKRMEDYTRKTQAIAKTRRPSAFKTWWLYLWAVTAAVILGALFVLPFRWWSLLTFVTFGTMEGIGVYVSGPYPPLTDVIRKFLPAWVTFPVIYALVTWAGTRWFHWPHSLGVGLLAGLLGWFQQHFDGKYDS